MEDQSKQDIGKIENTGSTQNYEQQGINRPDSPPQVPPPHTATRTEDVEQDSQTFSGEGVLTERPESRGLAKGYTHQNAMQEYDREEMSPQIAEFWKYTNADYEQRGYI